MGVHGEPGDGGPIPRRFINHNAGISKAWGAISLRITGRMGTASVTSNHKVLVMVLVLMTVLVMGLGMLLVLVMALVLVLVMVLVVAVLL